MIIIYEIIAVGLIICPLNPSTKLRQHHNFDILIFQPHRRIFPVLLFIADLLDGRIRVYFSAAALIDAFVQKDRIFFRRPDLVGRNHGLLHPYFCYTHCFSLSFLFPSYPGYSPIKVFCSI